MYVDREAQTYINKIEYELCKMRSDRDNYRDEILNLRKENEKLKQMLRKLATETDEYLNGSGHAMDLADLISEAERMLQIEAG